MKHPALAYFSGSAALFKVEYNQKWNSSRYIVFLLLSLRSPPTPRTCNILPSSFDALDQRQTHTSKWCLDTRHTDGGSYIFADAVLNYVFESMPQQATFKVKYRKEFSKSAESWGGVDEDRAHWRCLVPLVVLLVFLIPGISMMLRVSVHLPAMICISDRSRLCACIVMICHFSELQAFVTAAPDWSLLFTVLQVRRKIITMNHAAVPLPRMLRWMHGRGGLTVCVWGSWSQLSVVSDAS